MSVALASILERKRLPLDCQTWEPASSESSPNSCRRCPARCCATGSERKAAMLTKFFTSVLGGSSTAGGTRVASGMPEDVEDCGVPCGTVAAHWHCSWLSRLMASTQHNFYPLASSHSSRACSASVTARPQSNSASSWSSKAIWLGTAACLCFGLTAIVPLPLATAESKADAPRWTSISSPASLLYSDASDNGSHSSPAKVAWIQPISRAKIMGHFPSDKADHVIVRYQTRDKLGVYSIPQWPENWIISLHFSCGFTANSREIPKIPTKMRKAQEALEQLRIFIRCNKNCLVDKMCDWSGGIHGILFCLSPGTWGTWAMW